MIRKVKVGNKVVEYRETIKHSCGCIMEYVTAYKLKRELVKEKRETECCRCQLAELLRPGKRRTE